MSREVMQQALNALVEVLEVVECDLIGVNQDCCGRPLQHPGDGSGMFCGTPIYADDRVKNAIDALQKALGLQGEAA